jgi:hypothetical protein
MQELMNLCSAFGLSGAAGLNAYIPLLTVGIMQNRGWLHLASPYDVLGSGWCIGLLIVLLIVEIVVDKVPGADHINDIIHTAIRPAAGAIVFASQAGIIHGVHPAVWITIGLLMSGGVHAAKALARPVVNVTTAGFGAPIVSLVEDLVSTVLAIVSVLAPILAVVLLGFFGWVLYKIFKRFFGKGARGGRGIALPVKAVAMDAPAEQAVGAGSRFEGGI